MKRIEYRWLRIIHKVDIQIKNHRFYPQSNSKSEQKKIFRFSVLHNNWLRTRRGSEQLQNWKQKSVGSKRVSGLVVSTAVLAAMSSMLGYTFQHYFMIYLPAMAALICMIFAEISSDIRKVVVVLLLLLLPYSYQIARNIGKCFIINATDYFEDVYDNVALLENVIPDEEKDSVWGYGITTSKYFAVNDITPSFKIFDFYTTFTIYPPFLDEAEMMLEQNPPKWIFRFVGDVSLGENIENMIQTGYERVDVPELEKAVEQEYGGRQYTGIEVFRRNDQFRY